ncbi:hypothetical protein O3G_MSEX003862 [Manduca sexta]|uniref:Uncharacterized protein n=1 Tax=Manduca sexta TaxID=7130 RepID=A0A922CGH5_MANSE|nr:hypothetical protein O3G_MSEX003862 [Manduca sexta]
MSITRVVAITGCDSGLGWAIAARSAREGLVTVAGMYQGVNTQAADSLRKLYAHPFPLDVRDPESVAGFRDYVKCLLKDNPNYKLHAIVNNAGVMTIGNYEWQPPSTIENTINVNLLGAMRLVTAFMPDLRKTALEPLPGFGVYSASKAGLLAWTRALRHEHREHGLSVVAFVPGKWANPPYFIFKYGQTMVEGIMDIEP